MKKIGNILWGLVFIALGGIIACNALGVTNINIFFDGWWTLLILIPCFIGIFKSHNKIVDIIGLIIGIYLLLACQNILDIAMVWKLVLPVILIGIGFSFIVKDIVNSNINKQIKKINKNTSGDEYCATFATQSIDFNDKEFKGTKLTAVFGSIECDLRKSIINEDIVVNTSSVFGGIEILVPKNVKVKIKSTPIFGGVSDKATHSSSSEAHIIYINADCVFGGVDIK